MLGLANAAAGTNRRGVVRHSGQDIGVSGDGGDVGVLGLGSSVGVEGVVTNLDGIAITGDVSDLGATAVGGHFIGGGPNHALALKADGPIRFPASSGIATIPSGQTNVNVTGVYCPAGTKILATLMDLPGVGNPASSCHASQRHVVRGALPDGRSGQQRQGGVVAHQLIGGAKARYGGERYGGPWRKREYSGTWTPLEGGTCDLEPDAAWSRLLC